MGGILEFLSSRSLFRGDCGARRSLADLACGAQLKVSRKDPQKAGGSYREPHGGFDSLTHIYELPPSLRLRGM